MTGWNLPPGCEVHHIPGNRPEDMLAEAVAYGWRPRCVSCGGYLRLAIETAERGEQYLEYRTCTKCGHETIDLAIDLESIYGKEPQNDH